MDLEFIRDLVDPNDKKIVLLVMDGLGGLPMSPGKLSELEAADSPHLDQLAAQGICGLQQPVGPGITPGSGPGHLGLFGYDPLVYRVGRGVLSALGIDFELGPDDVAARGNFCTLDEHGRVADRRAGRISSEKNQQLIELLREIKLPEVEIFLRTVKEYRFLLVLRGEGLAGEVSDTDPQEVGEEPLAPRALTPQAEKTARLVSQFLQQASEILSGHQPANMVLLRGFSMRPNWPPMQDVFGLNPAAIAGYPMYRGVSKLIGMTVLDTGSDLEEEFQVLEENWDNHDYFFFHVKRIDSAGEDGDFERKVMLIEEVDKYIPRVMDLNPDVLIVTGDHSTPSIMKAHGFQPVPVIIWSRYCRSDRVEKFGERECMNGGLGPRIPAKNLMPIALANAMRLKKYGA
jgi:2,3-bisphosphoglycerate-independent phosphoglycerate mutase